MKKIGVYIIIVLFLSGCELFDLPEIPESKKLNSRSEKMYDQLLKELEAENIVYSYIATNNDGNKKLYFKSKIEYISTSHLSDDEFKEYSIKILEMFDESGFDFSTVDEYTFYYYVRPIPPSDLRIFLSFNSDRKLIEKYTDKWYYY